MVAPSTANALPRSLVIKRTSACLNHVGSRALNHFTAIAVSVFAQEHSSEQSEAQITGAHYRRSLLPLSLFAENFHRVPNAECSVYSYSTCPRPGPLPRKYTIPHLYGSLRLSSRSTVTTKRCGRKSCLSFRISHPMSAQWEHYQRDI